MRFADQSNPVLDFAADAYLLPIGLDTIQR